jgi:hypothetical protein
MNRRALSIVPVKRRCGQRRQRVSGMRASVPGLPFLHACIHRAAINVWEQPVSWRPYVITQIESGLRVATGNTRVDALQAAACRFAEKFDRPLFRVPRLKFVRNPKAWRAPAARMRGFLQMTAKLAVNTTAFPPAADMRLRHCTRMLRTA